MNKILTIALLFTANSLFAQNAQKTNAILKAVQEIKLDGSYTTKTLNTDQFLDVRSGESGQLIGYFKSGHIAQMNVRIALATCIKTDKYYFQNDSLIMFYRQERPFPYNESTKTYDSSHPMNGMDCRYYYDGNQVLKTDSNGEPKCSEKPSEQQAMQEIATAQKYVKLLKK